MTRGNEVFEDEVATDMPESEPLCGKCKEPTGWLGRYDSDDEWVDLCEGCLYPVRS